MELKLSQAIYASYQEKGIELTVKQVEKKAQDIFDYWVDSCLEDVLETEDKPFLV